MKRVRDSSGGISAMIFAESHIWVPAFAGMTMGYHNDNDTLEFNLHAGMFLNFLLDEPFSYRAEDINTKVPGLLCSYLSFTPDFWVPNIVKELMPLPCEFQV